MDESGTDKAECRRNATSGRRAGSTIRSLDNARGLQLECARVLHENLLGPILMYDSERTIWKEKE